MQGKLTKAQRFNPNLGRSQQYREAYRAAIKDAITWLHDEAKSMNDPHATIVLNNAAFHMGVDAALKESSNG